MALLASSLFFVYYTPVSQACDNRTALNQLPLEQIARIVVCGILMPLEGTWESRINKKA